MFVSSERSLKSVLAHWKRRLSDGSMEGLNSLFQAAKRKGRRYRANECLITMLHFIAGELRRPQG